MNCKMLSRLTAFIFLFFIAGKIFSQQAGTLIRGKIVGKDSLPLAGVTVQIKDKAVTATTDANGEFSILSPLSSGTLVFTSVGFQQREIRFDGASRIDVRLEESV